jgi:hypothetical protein
VIKKARCDTPASWGPIAAVGDGAGQIQIAVTGRGGVSNALVHSVRQTNGQWTPFGDVKNIPGAPLQAIDVALSAD